MAGLIKVLLSLKNEVLYPHARFDQPNPLINFAQSAIYIQDTLQSWPQKEDNTRLAAVSSMGLSGTNAHAVVQEAPYSTLTQNSSGAKLISLSAKNKQSLIQGAERLLLSLNQHPERQLSDLAYTLSRRSHFSHRLTFLSDNTTDLKEQILLFLSDFEEAYSPSDPVDKLILLLTDLPEAPSDMLMEKGFKWAEKGYREFLSHLAAGEEPNEEQQKLALLFATYQVIESLVSAPLQILSIGLGKIALEIIQGSLTKAEGLQKASIHKPQSIDRLEERTSALLAKESSAGKVAFISLDGREELSQALLGHKGSQVFAAKQESAEIGLWNLWKELYINQADLDWATVYPRGSALKVDLPTYAFEKVRCWIRETPRHPGEASDLQHPNQRKAKIQVLEAEAGYVSKEIAHIWQRVLDLEQKSISLEQNFFQVKGNSILANQVIREIQSVFGVQLDFEDIFDYPTLRELSGLVSEELDSQSFLIQCWKEILKTESIGPHDDFFDLGGHSLMANQVLSRIRQAFKVDLDFEEIFENPTAAELAAYIDRQRQVRHEERGNTSLKITEEQEDYPLTHMQLRVWLLSRYADGGQAYVSSVVHRLRVLARV